MCDEGEDPMTVVNSLTPQGLDIYNLFTNMNYVTTLGSFVDLHIHKIITGQSIDTKNIDFY